MEKALIINKMIPTWVVIVVPIALVIISAFIGFKCANMHFKKQLKKKPYMNRRQIKAIFKVMGIQISEAYVNMMEQNFKKTLEDKK